MPAPEESPEYSLPIAEIRTRLHASHEIGRDPVLGAKHEFVLQDGRGTLEVFPTAGITRVDTPTALIQVAVQPRVDPGDGQGITFDLSDAGAETALTLHPDGAVLFSRVPAAPTEPTRVVETTRSAPPLLRSDGTLPDQQTDVTATSPESPSEPKGDGAPETEPRVQLTGRLGRAPTFRTSPRGTLVGSFSLAVHREDGSTVWHSIVAFGNRAQQLQHRVETRELMRGREVDVVGYPHTREVPGKDGSTRTVTEIHAAAVVKRS